ncbi:Uncharacterised protein [Salmonella enterica subsp. enterica serovar Bovismorbificans]|uniref:Uncharacterized protein n=1 Tax=Salmonella enterica subsp. enterica serovar Bovismorbificans TaxID=58097 RepID=A0A655BVN1_SALET|nr:Uncharacterised protein [Salmonella enterica subsp. enterica serovar Bovismorbificans]
MTISAQRLPIHPRQRYRVEDLIARQPQHFSDHRGRGHFHQQHMVKPDTVEGVFQRDATLNFMGFDHPAQYLFHGQRRFAGGDGVA